MLSVLEMQGLLRTGQLTATELTTIALECLEKYDPEYNMLEVELKDLAYSIAAEADAKFAAGEFVSPIQGIPFAVKDTVRQLYFQHHLYINHSNAQNLLWK